LILLIHNHLIQNSKPSAFPQGVKSFKTLAAQHFFPKENNIIDIIYHAVIVK